MSERPPKPSAEVAEVSPVQRRMQEVRKELQELEDHEHHVTPGRIKDRTIDSRATVLEDELRELEKQSKTESLQAQMEELKRKKADLERYFNDKSGRKTEEYNQQIQELQQQIDTVLGKNTVESETPAVIVPPEDQAPPASETAAEAVSESAAEEPQSSVEEGPSLQERVLDLQQRAPQAKSPEEKAAIQQELDLLEKELQSQGNNAAPEEDATAAAEPTTPHEYHMKLEGLIGQFRELPGYGEVNSAITHSFTPFQNPNREPQDMPQRRPDAYRDDDPARISFRPLGDSGDPIPAPVENAEGHPLFGQNKVLMRQINDEIGTKLKKPRAARIASKQAQERVSKKVNAAPKQRYVVYEMVQKNKKGKHTMRNIILGLLAGVIGLNAGVEIGKEKLHMHAPQRHEQTQPKNPGPISQAPAAEGPRSTPPPVRVERAHAVPSHLQRHLHEAVQKHQISEDDAGLITHWEKHFGGLPSNADQHIKYAVERLRQNPNDPNAFANWPFKTISMRLHIHPQQRAEQAQATTPAAQDQSGLPEAHLTPNSDEAPVSTPHPGTLQTESLDQWNAEQGFNPN